MAKKKNHVAAYWDVIQKNRKFNGPGGMPGNITVATLRADGASVHVLEGPTAYESLSKFAAEQNRKGASAPAKLPRTRADGWRQSSKSHLV